MTDLMVQVGIIVLSGAAILLVTRRHRWSRWAYPLGLAGQPLWLYATVEAKQWGMLVLVAIYTWAWGEGLWSDWILPWYLRRTRHVAFRR